MGKITDFPEDEDDFISDHEQRDMEMEEAVRDAIMKEREACAKIADKLFLGFHSPYEYSDDVAEAIRERAEK